MRSVQEVLQQMQRVSILGSAIKSGHAEALTKILADDEEIRGVVMGQDGMKMTFLVASDRRMVVMRTAAFGALNTEVLPYEKITSVECDTGSWLSPKGKVTIHASGTRVELTTFPKFAEEVRRWVQEGVLSSKGSPSSNVVDELEKLVRMKEAGHITEDEFQELKAKLLK